jgi:hypothetical protein
MALAAASWVRFHSCSEETISVDSHQATVRFVHERGALQSVVCSFVAQLMPRQAAQFLMDARQQGVECLAVSAPPIL